MKSCILNSKNLTNIMSTDCSATIVQFGFYEANPECNNKQNRHAAGQFDNMKTLFDSHSPTVQYTTES